jgi:hypothetical protein
MPIEQAFLSDFTGGEIAAISSIEPSERQWLLLEGLVLDQNGRLRAQWAGVTWDTGDDSP